MANEEHVARLLRGVEAWNTWRAEHPETTPDLLAANLVGANLVGANLIGVNLTAANLQASKLIAANLTGANLTGANLTGANLVGTNLQEAPLTGANLMGANFGKTIFANVDLKEVKGLSSCLHLGPSIIDSQTLQRGPLSVEFLRGCGLSDWEIEVSKLYHDNLSLEQITDITYRLHELSEDKPIRFQSCFISYSSGDEPVAKKLYAGLQKNDVRCWFSPEDLKIGERFRARIDKAIYQQDRPLLILSRFSLASPWVEKEVETAFEKEKEQDRTVLFPIRVDDAVLDSRFGWAADIRRTRHIGDFTQWQDEAAYQQTFARLLRDLQAVPSSAEVPAKPQD